MLLVCGYERVGGIGCLTSKCASRGLLLLMCTGGRGEGAAALPAYRRRL